MTVCVAAFGSIGPDTRAVLVTASDRMITVGDIEYEPEQTKAVILATHTVALLAGDMQVHASVCQATMSSLRTSPPNPFLVKDIAERYASEFALHRRYIAEKEILIPLGMTFNDFFARQREFSHDFVMEVANRLLGHHLNAQAIIAGIDQTGPHIYTIIDPGEIVSFDTACFAAIGVGRNHAESYLMASEYSKNVPEENVIFSVFSAKVNAEIAAGVGGRTDLIIVNPDGLYQATKDEVEYLRTIIEKKSVADRVNEKEAVLSLRNYIGERREFYRNQKEALSNTLSRDSGAESSTVEIKPETCADTSSQ